ILDNRPLSLAPGGLETSNPPIHFSGDGVGISLSSGGRGRHAKFPKDSIRGLVCIRVLNLPQGAANPLQHAPDRPHGSTGSRLDFGNGAALQVQGQDRPIVLWQVSKQTPDQFNQDGGLGRRRITGEYAGIATCLQVLVPARFALGVAPISPVILNTAAALPQR